MEVRRHKIGSDRRQFIKSCLGSMVAAGAIGSESFAKNQNTNKHAEHTERADLKKKNVLFITVEDMKTSLGCYGHPIVKSPNIDKLAQKGVKFESAYCQFPVCNPSRTSFLTGLRPDSTGILENVTPFRSKLPEVVTLPGMFKEQGYFTARIGKIFHSEGEYDDVKAWTETYDPKCSPVGEKGHGRNLTDGAVEWCSYLAADGDDDDQVDGKIAQRTIELLKRKRDKPFFIAAGFHKPHDPFNAPKKYFDMYPLDQLVAPKIPGDRSPENKLMYGGSWKAEFDKFSDRDRCEFMRAYYACITFVDAQIGKLLAELERQNIIDDTIIIFVADHGYHLGEHNWWNKNTVYEESALAPLIINAPGETLSGRSCDSMVEFVDIYPTLADLCSLKPPANLEGTSFRPLLSDPSLPWKIAAFTQTQYGKVAARSIRTKRWRYTEWDKGREAVELYDHASDAGEYYNLADNPLLTEVKARLQKLLYTGHNQRIQENTNDNLLL